MPVVCYLCRRGKLRIIFTNRCKRVGLPAFYCVARTDREYAMNGRIAYRQQFTRCGKERCRKCKEGEGHGPYWYAYWSENGRTKSKYIGVRPPPELETAQLQATFIEGQLLDGLGTTLGTQQTSVGTRSDARSLPTPVLR